MRQPDNAMLPGETFGVPTTFEVTVAAHVGTRVDVNVSLDRRDTAEAARARLRLEERTDAASWRHAVTVVAVDRAGNRSPAARGTARVP